MYNMDILIEIVGYMAGTCMAIAQFPQAYKVYQTKDTHSISITMFSILTLGVLLWFTYGVLTNSIPMWLTNGICLLPSCYILITAIKNHIKDKNNATT